MQVPDGISINRKSLHALCIFNLVWLHWLSGILRDCRKLMAGSRRKQCTHEHVVLFVFKIGTLALGPGNLIHYQMLVNLMFEGIWAIASHVPLWRPQCEPGPNFLISTMIFFLSAEETEKEGASQASWLPLEKIWHRGGGDLLMASGGQVSLLSKHI